MNPRPADTDTAPRTTPARPRSPVAWLAMLLIKLYQRTALLRSPRCRFYPTCSQYALDSIRVHGAVRGLGYAIARVARCHPWHPGGLDPVKPPRPGRSNP